MNQLSQSDSPETVFKKACAKTAYAFDSALFWLEDNWRPVLGSLSAALLVTAVYVSVANQNAIDRDGEIVRKAAAPDGIKVEGIASGIRAGKVLANIAIGDCNIVDSTLTVGYEKGAVQIDDYTVPVVITTDGAQNLQTIHIRNAGDLQNISPFAAVCS